MEQRLLFDLIIRRSVIAAKIGCKNAGDRTALQLLEFLLYISNAA